jgi:NodT family efflux transporter outer membrane factor (OMF) lipoprotein
MRRLAILLATAALTGCVAGPDYARPDTATRGAFVRANDASAETPAARWWEALGDPVLDGLVAKGLADAPQVAVARARLRQARSGITASRASLLPVLSASATYIYADLPDSAFGTGGGEGFYTVGIDAQWEADLWGGKRREVEQAVARAGEAGAGLANAQVSLSAEIARTYTTLRAREHSLGLLRQRLGEEQRLAGLAETRFKGGTGTRQPLLAARQRIARSEGEIAGIGADIAALQDALAVLTGQAPGALDALEGGVVPLPPVQVAVGDPAALLQRRPDVLAAERRLANATAGVGVAQARRFPSVSLLGLIGIGGTAIGDVFDFDQRTTAAMPRLSWNFLDFGRVSAGIDAAQAGRDAALAEYDAAVLAALRDAEAALARFGGARIAWRAAGEGLAQGQEIARLQKMRADAGTGDPVEAIEARIALVEARLAQANARASLTLSYIALAKALGLGWEVTEAVQ